MSSKGACVRAVVGLIALTLAVSCSDEEGAGGGSDVAGDGAADGGAPDADLDDGEAGASCLGAAVLDETWEVDEDGPDTQIHGAAAFDGEAVWVAYTRPELDGANFETWATRVGCDGAVLVEPMRLHEVDGVNRTDPSVAVSGEDVVVAWQADDSSQIANLDIEYRLLSRDGELGALRTLAASRGGVANEGNAWMVDVDPLPAGGFGLAGVWAVDEVGRFQVFAQRLNAAGDVAGDAIDVGIEAEVSQTVPTLATGADGRMLVGWIRTPDEGESTAWRASIAPDAATTEAPTGELTGSEGAAFVAVALGPNGEEIVAISDGNSPITLMAAGRSESVGPAASLGLSPSLAWGEDLGIVVWVRPVRGPVGEPVLQSFTLAGGLTLGGVTQVTPSSSVAAYPPAVAHVGGNVFFVAWSEGSNPDFRLRGRLVSVEQ